MRLTRYNREGVCGCEWSGRGPGLRTDCEACASPSQTTAAEFGRKTAPDCLSRFLRPSEQPGPDLVFGCARGSPASMAVRSGCELQPARVEAEQRSRFSCPMLPTRLPENLPAQLRK